MAKSVFRRFPDDTLTDELPEWNDVNMDGQAFIRSGVKAAAWDVCEDFWEAPAGGGPPTHARRATAIDGIGGI